MVAVPRPGSTTSSLRPKAFLVPRLAHHHSRRRPLRSHHRPRQLCVVASIYVRGPSSSAPPPPRNSRVPVTEIDFQTYLQQVDLVFNGQRDYARLFGDTGPLVYVLLPLPASHFLPTFQHSDSRIKLSSRPRPPPSRPQTYPRCHITRHHPVHLRRTLPRLPIPSRLDIL